VPGREKKADGDELLKEAVDPEKLLEGEDPGSAHPEDAAHWYSVYRELRDFKLKLIEQTSAMTEEMSPDAQRVVEGTDLPILRLELARLETRLKFWKARRPDAGSD
jgi:hypothetical protein